ncbi:MAG TPA: hypothetical protein VK427_13785 [Kofleriaceae bacterium]|nr:hypothetical protein [Kofleriaceae bacterium]
MRAAWQVQTTFVMEPLEFDNGDTLSFRLEIQVSLPERDIYRVVFWRTEMFVATPAFPDGTRQCTDEFALVDDAPPITGASEAECVSRAIEYLRQTYGR